MRPIERVETMPFDVLWPLASAVYEEKTDVDPGRERWRPAGTAYLTHHAVHLGDPRRSPSAHCGAFRKNSACESQEAALGASWRSFLSAPRAWHGRKHEKGGQKMKPKAELLWA